ncbi:hypothetical protein PISMIDRAFT_466802 [Pisolithus microcarpus 441]|uniref:Uncharacterized protein n=1 Tax=Pisolithus microcarpus 441 TaxID=765257 RepID=A0A0C9ZBG7_9AGAM|nr:hypothetical protein PISMIDRAFT_466802 [Pisolithus microcarpus 441]
MAKTIPIISCYQCPHQWFMPTVIVRSGPYAVNVLHTGPWTQPITAMTSTGWLCAKHKVLTTGKSVANKSGFKHRQPAISESNMAWIFFLVPMDGRARCRPVTIHIRQDHNQSDADVDR